MAFSVLIAGAFLGPDSEQGIGAILCFYSLPHFPNTAPGRGESDRIVGHYARTLQSFRLRRDDPFVPIAELPNDSRSTWTPIEFEPGMVRVCLDLLVEKKRAPGMESWTHSDRDRAQN